MPHQEEQAITSGEQIDQSKTADLERVRAAGWTERSAVDYATVTDQAADSGDWFGTAKVYEWKGEYGDVGPQVPELEKILFGGDFRVRQGEHLNNLEFEVAVEGPVKIAPVRKVCLRWFPAKVNIVDVHLVRGCWLASHCDVKRRDVRLCKANSNPKLHNPGRPAGHRCDCGGTDRYDPNGTSHCCFLFT